MVKQTIFIFTVRGNITGCAAAGRDRETVVLRRSSPHATGNCTHGHQSTCGWRSTCMVSWDPHAWPEKQILLVGQYRYQIIKKNEKRKSGSKYTGYLCIIKHNNKNEKDREKWWIEERRCKPPRRKKRQMTNSHCTRDSHNTLERYRKLQ